MTGLSKQAVSNIASLAKLPLTANQEKKLQAQFEETLKTVSKIDELDTTNVEPTSQVSGLTNVVREDVVDSTRILTQDEAVSQAKKVYNGFVVVEALIEI